MVGICEGRRREDGSSDGEEERGGAKRKKEKRGKEDSKRKGEEESGGSTRTSSARELALNSVCQWESDKEPEANVPFSIVLQASSEGAFPR
uniref:Uncharacterized protein n=1 Tax=Vespula pensylvanica TaxID=30213 RepID=A0A834KM69_VESPE|nr:hypothetical protein H0235_014047 [Vespula pensylvanica]